VLFEEEQGISLCEFWVLCVIVVLLDLLTCDLTILRRPLRRSFMTRLDEERLHIMMAVAGERVVRPDEIVQCEVVQFELSRFWRTPYAPGLTFPSECIRVRGNRGVRLDLTDGLHLLIGSQEPERWAAAILSQKAASAGARVR
jgi:hypothetical protein